jgi:EpsI family protein
MKSSIYRAVAVALVVVLAAGLAEVLKPRELMARSAVSFDLEGAFPDKFGDWKIVPGVGVVTPSEVEGVVDTDTQTTLYSKEASRTYVNRDGQMVMMLVAYGPVQNHRLKSHRPEICYSAAGFRVSEKFGGSVQLNANETIKLTRLVTQRETRFEPVTYWMRVGNDVVTGIVDRQLVRIKYGLRGLIPDGALVRFSTVGIEKNQSFAVQDRFIRDFMNSIESSKRPFFVGV